MEKIKIQLIKLKNNLLSCQYCDKIMHKSQIAKFFIVNVIYVFIAKRN